MRKINSLRNFLTTIIPTIVLTLLGFVKVNIFMEKLGLELYVLNQLFFQIFSYLSLVEGGFGALIQHQYYKYIAEDNKQMISNIYWSSVKIFKKISFVILIIGVLVSFALELLTNNNLPLIYMQIVFFIFLVKSLLEYFSLPPILLIQSYQKSYKVNLIINSFRVLENIVEILLLSLSINYIKILIVTSIVRAISYRFSSKKVFKEFPWLSIDVTPPTEKVEFQGMSNIIALKISGTVKNNTDLLLISSLLSPLMAASYSAYNYIIKFLNDSVYMLSNSITSSFASFFFNDDENELISIFNELNILFSFITVFLVVALYATTEAFISIWVGPDKVLVHTTFVLMLTLLFINTIRRPLIMSQEILNLYGETRRSTLLEASINLLLSIMLGKKYGLFGILLATLISTLFTTFINYPIVIYEKAFQKPPLPYFLFVGKTYAFTILSCVVIESFNLKVSSASIIPWFTHSVLFSLVLLLLLFIIYFIFSKSFRVLVDRLYGMLKKYINI